MVEVCSLTWAKWCPIEDREVPYSEIKKGYEVEKEDLDKIKIKTTEY